MMITEDGRGHYRRFRTGQLYMHVRDEPFTIEVLNRRYYSDEEHRENDKVSVTNVLDTYELKQLIDMATEKVSAESAIRIMALVDTIVKALERDDTFTYPKAEVAIPIPPAMNLNIPQGEDSHDNR